MKSSAKVKSFHVAVQGSFPQHMTLPSRILIRRPADERFSSKKKENQRSSESSSKRSSESSLKRHQHHERNHHLNRRTINGPPTGDQKSSYRPSPYERSVELVVATQPSNPSSVPSPWNHEGSIDQVVATELQTIQHPSHTGEVRKPSGCRRACVE